MSKSNVVELSGREPGKDELSELIRNGAKKLIAGALEAEVSALLAEFSGDHDEDGRAAVVRNGYQPEREIQTGIGPVKVTVPKVRTRGGEAVVGRRQLVFPVILPHRKSYFRAVVASLRIVPSEIQGRMLGRQDEADHESTIETRAVIEC